MTREISEYKPREPEIKYGPKKKSKLRKYAVRGGIFAAFAGVASYFVPKLLGGNNESPQNVDGPPNGPPDYLMNKNQMDPVFLLIVFAVPEMILIKVLSNLKKNEKRKKIDQNQIKKQKQVDNVYKFQNN
ncbi:hypothetical protein BLOT_014246 [Blomia tropicalis]|nr:hypothetical protein BLOT_014246 [Blomia tropicalis]